MSADISTFTLLIIVLEMEFNSFPSGSQDALLLSQSLQKI